MRIGILGSGLMGSKLGTIFARAGHEVIFSDARSINKLKRLARDAGENAHAGTPREAAENADALLLAVHWNQIDDVLAQAGDLSSKVIISCSLPLNAQNTELVVAHTSSGAEALAKKFPKARFISAFHTVPSEVLFDVFENRHKANKPSLLYCSDHSGSQRCRLTSLSRRPAESGSLLTRIPTRLTVLRERRRFRRLKRSLGKAGRFPIYG